MTFCHAVLANYYKPVLLRATPGRSSFLLFGQCSPLEIHGQDPVGPGHGGEGPPGPPHRPGLFLRHGPVPEGGEHEADEKHVQHRTGVAHHQGEGGGEEGDPQVQEQAEDRLDPKGRQAPQAHRPAQGLPQANSFPQHPQEEGGEGPHHSQEGQPAPGADEIRQQIVAVHVGHPGKSVLRNQKGGIHRPQPFGPG